MVLERIVTENRPWLETRKRDFPLAELQRMALELSPPLDMAAALRGDGIRLIAEVKKASPSRGLIRADFDPVEIARIYTANGAAAISVLTESLNFQGSLGYLRSIREALGNDRLPLLRKDFIVEPYQVYEARAYGADALLLIAAILEYEKLSELLELSHELGMKCLVEVHNEAEMEIALKSQARIIGINNRDLRDFSVDLAVTGRLRPLVPGDRIVVSESGIKDRCDVEWLRNLGVDAVLVGETLMSAPDIAARMKELL
ncbi:MAG: indole-3-glycerol phosphate synthase TrpC [Dehalococcoidales bacterium]|nr:indole-3-glycerol phosphate synthase TrpC [Dehalococcoidales bacterium]